MRRRWRLAAAAAVVLCALPAVSGWLLEGLVASWAVPDVHGSDRKRAEPERTQPLQLPDEQDQEPLELAPLSRHTATPPPRRAGRRTSAGGDDQATPTVRDIETTVQLYRLLKDRQRDRNAVTSAAAWKESRPACIQRFICEVHMQEEHELARAAETEKSVANTLKRFSMESPSSVAYQYTYAAHMGRLMRDSQKSGCHELFSTCPFSKQDMLLLMQSINGGKSSLA